MIKVRLAVLLSLLGASVGFAACGKSPGRRTGLLPATGGTSGLGGAGQDSEGGAGGSPSGDGDGDGDGDNTPGDGDSTVIIPDTAPECEGVVCSQGIYAGCFVFSGTPVCLCKPGFQGTDVCEDYDECPATALDPSPCVDNAECFNVHGSFRCECDPGYEGDGEDAGEGCSNEDECDRGTHGCLDGICSNTEGSYNCECPNGEFGDGVFCKGTDSCVGDPCNGNTCVNTPDGFLCECALGSSGADCSDTTSCDDITFADAAVEAAVRAVIGVESGTISAADFDGFTSLSVPQEGVTDLGGLECWTNLEELDISFNEVSDLSPLADLGSLRVLDAACNSLTSLSSLGPHAKLEELYLDKPVGPVCMNATQLADFAGFEKLTGLRVLFVGGHDVSDLSPLSGLGRLLTLEAANNGVTTLVALSPLRRRGNEPRGPQSERKRRDGHLGVV